MKKTGFTLIEVVISTAIMVSVLIALVYSLTQASNVTTTARNQDIALNAIQDRMEQIANDVANIQTYHNQAFAVTRIDPQQGVVRLLTPPAGMAQPGLITVNQIGATNLFNVTVSVTWQQKGRVLNRQLNATFIRK